MIYMTRHVRVLGRRRRNIGIIISLLSKIYVLLLLLLSLYPITLNAQSLCNCTLYIRLTGWCWDWGGKCVKDLSVYDSLCFQLFFGTIPQMLYCCPMVLFLSSLSIHCLT